MIAALASIATLPATACYISGDPIDGTTGVSGSGGATTSSATGADTTAGDESGSGGGSVAPLTYYIAETTNFNQSAVASCLNSNVNQVGDLFQAALDADGWSGTYVLNGQTTLDEFVDPMAPGVPWGQDDVAADAVTLALYAGHGATAGNFIQWGNPSANTLGCNLGPMSNFMRLGADAGDVAQFLVLVTSCTAHVPNLEETLLMNGLGQLVGWHNSPWTSEDVVAEFYRSTRYNVGGLPITNRLAWMSAGDIKPGLGNNSPVIFSFNGSATEIEERHMDARLGLGQGIETPPTQNPYDPMNFPPARFTWIDNGDGPCF